MKPFHEPHKLEIGVDEAGRGPFLGPVFAAAVIWDPNLTEPEMPVCDSKKLKTEAKLERSYNYIIDNALAYGIAQVSETEIDQINILQATFKAMKSAIDQCELAPDTLLIDGDKFDVYFDRQGNPVECYTIPKGDDTYFSIAAASILAKWSRDKYILDLCKQYPELDERYQISRNKGYGAPAHREGIRKYGITQFHRQSFKCCSGFQLTFLQALD